MIKYSVLAAFTALILAGCAGPGSQSDSKSNEQVGVYSTEENLKASEQLQAAQQLFDSGDYDEAEIVLNRIEFNSLTIAQQTNFALLRAATYLKQSEPQQTLYWLAGEFTYLFDGLPMDEQIEIALLRAEAWEMSGQYLTAARERIYLAPVLEGDVSAINHELIWADLQLVPLDQIEEKSLNETVPDFKGWLELARLSFEYESDLDQHLKAINSWKRKNSRHPAAKQLPGGLEILAQLNTERPEHVGLLLPLTGNLGQTGRAIRDGFMAAYYQALEAGIPVPKVSISDTATGADIINQYDQLVFEGAELVIGPLSKKNVRILQAELGLPVPVLALNQGEDTLEQPANFYQFGLSPEDEAMQVAQKLYQDGHRNVAALVPSGSWGSRISNAFLSQFDSLGGEVVSLNTFGGKADGDYLQVVRNLFNINSSLERTAEIERVIDEDVEYELRRRQDVDAIFIAALPTQARQLMPMFDFQYAGDLPVYGISTTYSGTTNRTLDKDINGIQFVDLPWQLSTNKLKTRLDDIYGYKETAGLERLYALGVDAYQLHLRLRQLTVAEGTRLHGQTGVLSLDDQQRIRRELTWATISNGAATVIPQTDITDFQ